MEGYAKYVQRTWTKKLLHKGFLWFLGWFFRNIMSLEVRGLENVPEEGAYIIAANHNGHGDHGAIYFALGKRREKLKIVGARDHFFEGARAILGMFWNAAIGAVPLERREGEKYAIQSKKDLAFLEDLLAKGHLVLIYPEGGRKPRENGWGLCEFKRGVGLLARRGEVPVIPCAIKGTEQFLTKTRGFMDFLHILSSPSRLKKKNIVACFGEPILPSAKGKKKSPTEITKEAEEAVQRLLDNII